MDEEALAAAAALGMPKEELAARRLAAKKAAEQAVLAVWPENWRPLLLAIAMQTQVRVTMNGAIGFDYTALPVVEALIDCPAPEDKTDRAAEFDAFRCIERILFSKD